MHHRHRTRHPGPHPLGEYARRHGFGHGRGGPRARRGDIRAAVLALLDERPMHGYEMIKELEERTGGAWSPSAGSIYPTLQLLEDEGLIAGEEAAGKRRFTLTDAGREHNAERSGAPPWEEVTAGFDPELLNLRHSIQKLSQTYGQILRAADPGQRKRIRELLDETRRKIYGILAEDE